MADGPNIGPDIAITVEAGNWLELLPDCEDRARRVAAAALGAADLEALDLSPDCAFEISIVLADDALVQRLNRDYRNQDKPTNVLSFAALDDDSAPLPEDGPVMLGDIILACETVSREAAEQGKSFADHMTHLVAHGVLHLLSYDHETDDEADEMETLETAILMALGVPDPYAGEYETGDR